MQSISMQSISSQGFPNLKPALEALIMIGENVCEVSLVRFQ